MRFVDRLQAAYRAFSGLDPVPAIERPVPIVDLLEMHPNDKLLVCFKSRLSDETCRRLRDHFQDALKGDKHVLVMGDEIPRLVIIRGFPKDIAVLDKKAA